MRSCDSDNNILECNEKQKLHKFAGAGIYYFSDVKLFNRYSMSCKSVSECINLMLIDQIKCKINTKSTRLGNTTTNHIEINKHNHTIMFENKHKFVNLIQNR